MSFNTDEKTVVIVGGSTGGASAAAKIRRMDENIRIILIERTQYVSTAYCGLAYAAGGIVYSQDELIPLTGKDLSKQFNIEVLLNCSVLSIDANKKKVEIRDEKSKSLRDVSYTSLLLAPGASSIIPDLEGSNLPGVFTLRNIPDLQHILDWDEAHKIKRVLIVGAGFIGLELSESFKYKSYDVHLVEAGTYVMPKMDADLMEPVHDQLRESGINLYLNKFAQRIELINKQHHVLLSDGQHLVVDMVVLATGIQSENHLAVDAGLTLGPDGGILVDSTMRTSDVNIFAIGDAAQMLSRITKKPVMVALAAPLSQQAGIAAANITGSETFYPGPIGSFVCKVFDLTVASTGVSESHLNRFEILYRKVIVPTTNHVFFYPGVEQILLKVLFDPNSGRLLGGQAVGGEGTEKRIDVLATAIAAGLTIFDLEQLELCYAPPYGAPRDPVNLAGSIGASLMRNETRGVYPDELSKLDSPFIIDIRSLDEHLVSTIPDAYHIPANQLRERANEIPCDRVVVVVCAIGSKANTSQRMLSHLGYNCYNLLGGFIVWRLFNPKKEIDNSSITLGLKRKEVMPCEKVTIPKGENVLDVRGLLCPGPIVAVSKRMKMLDSGACLEVIMSDPSIERDIHAWAKQSNCTTSDLTLSGSYYTFTLSKK